MISNCKLCRAASVTNGTIWIVSSHKHAEAKIRNDSVSFSPSEPLFTTLSLCVSLPPASVPVSLSTPESLFLSSLQHLEGFIHPNPSVLLTRPNSLHSFHSHLDSPSLSLFFFGFNLFPVFISFVSPPTVPRRLPLLSPLFFSYCFVFFHCELTPYLCQRKSSVMSTHRQVWQGYWQFEFLPLKLKPSAEHSGKTLRYRSDLSWTALSGCPCLVSLFTPPSHTRTQTDADLMFWPRIIWGAYAVRSFRLQFHNSFRPKLTATCRGFVWKGGICEVSLDEVWSDCFWIVIDYMQVCLIRNVIYWIRNDVN